jgi:hypothetical protein
MFTFLPYAYHPGFPGGGTFGLGGLLGVVGGLLVLLGALLLSPVRTPARDRRPESGVEG